MSNDVSEHKPSPRTVRPRGGNAGGTLGLASAATEEARDYTHLCVLLSWF